MKELPPSFGQNTKSEASMSGVMAGGARDKGILMASGLSSKKSMLNKSFGSTSTTDMFHQDPNTKQIL